MPITFIDGSAPGTPTSGRGVLYSKTDNKLYYKDASGDEFEVTGGGAPEVLINDSIITKIDQLIDRDVVRSNDKVSPFVEAYTGVDGRKGSVSIVLTKTPFDNNLNKYFPMSVEALGDTHHTAGNTGILLNDEECFKLEPSAETTANGSSTNVQFGKTFSSKNIKYVSLKGFFAKTGGLSGTNMTVSLESYDGSIWVVEHTVFSHGFGNNDITINRTYSVDKNIQGVRLNINCNNSFLSTVWNFSYGEDFVPSNTVHTIPSGTFKDNVKSGVAAVKIVDWEDGASLQWKATNTGYNTNSYVVIEATSVSANDFEINGCKLVAAGSGKWYLVNSSSDDEVARARIYKTLFYGSNGTNPRASSTYITGITALKTSVARDVGKQAHYGRRTANATSSTMRVTPTNTSTNTNCSAWFYLSQVYGDTTYIKFPSTNTIFSPGTGGSDYDDIGTDVSANEANNPDYAELKHNFTHARESDLRCFILTVGGVTWTGATSSEIDFLADNSIPVMTATTEASLNDDTGWKDFNISGDTAYAKISEFTAFTVEPTAFVVKLVPKTTSPTAGVPSIVGAGVKLI